MPLEIELEGAEQCQQRRKSKWRSPKNDSLTSIGVSNIGPDPNANIHHVIACTESYSIQP